MFLFVNNFDEDLLGIDASGNLLVAENAAARLRGDAKLPGEEPDRPVRFLDLTYEHAGQVVVFRAVAALYGVEQGDPNVIVGDFVDGDWPAEDFPWQAPAGTRVQARITAGMLNGMRQHLVYEMGGVASGPTIMLEMGEDRGMIVLAQAFSAFEIALQGTAINGPEERASWRESSIMLFDQYGEQPDITWNLGGGVVAWPQGKGAPAFDVGSNLLFVRLMPARFANWSYQEIWLGYWDAYSIAL